VSGRHPDSERSGELPPSSAEDLQSLLIEYIRSSDSPDLIWYGERAALASPERYIWFIRHVLRLSGAKNCTILDVGCGYGWESMLASLVGGNRVVALDVRDTYTDLVRERMDHMAKRGVRLDVAVITGDICEADLPLGAFDVVFCNETIEHVRDLDAMFARCAKLLSPGGRLVVIDSNNALNLRVRRRNAAMWAERDRSREFCRALQEERPLDNAGIEPYACTRERVVRTANPSLDHESVDRIVEATAGLVAADIESIAEGYDGGAGLPTPPPMAWCRDPITGEYCERLLDPFWVRDAMAVHGFHAQVRLEFRRFPLWALNGLGWKPIASRLFRIKGGFIVLGKLPGEKRGT